MYDEFQKRDTVVIAIAQEDKDLQSHGGFLKHFGDAGPRFAIACDVNREKTKAWDRVTTYLIDKQGVVRQVFPAMIRMRPSWHAVLNEIDRINGG
jgi:peroxiredoxin